MRRAVLLLAISSGVLGTSCGRSSSPLLPPAPPPPLEPSITAAPERAPVIPTRREPVVELLHGHRIEDPYRWLEDDHSPEVKDWVAEQNALLEQRLSALPERAAIHARLVTLLRIGDLSTPLVKQRNDGTPRLFYRRREGRQDQPVLYVRDGLAGRDRVLVDPNTLDTAGLVSLDFARPSPDGTYLAYGLSQDGSEDATLYVRNVATGKDEPDVITRARYASVCWLPDGKSFYYSRYPAPGSVPEGEERYHRKIYRHALGRSPEQDPLIFGADLPATDYPDCELSPNGRWLVISVHQGWNKTTLYLADTRKQPLDFTRLTGDADHVYDVIARDDRVLVRTNEGAPNYRLFSIDPARPSRGDWKLLIPERATQVLDRFNAIGEQIFAKYLKGPVTALERFAHDGASLGAVALPALGSSDGFSGAHDGDLAFYNFETFSVPPQVHTLALDTGKTELWQQVEAPVDASAFEVTEATATSADGTRVPYLVVRQRGPTTGPGPALLYGYGGFNVNLEPRFSRSILVFLERGGVFVQATLRGGGEFGEAWHRAGQLENKQNVFDDFAAVAKDLVARGVTTAERLAIHGRSNGGLLVAAMVTQHPELFRAAVSSVPLTDMLRYHQFLIGRLWIPEYGSAEDPKQFPWLYAYSPYHHVQPGTAYPAVLFTTADTDTRVAPLHARKMTAALQYASASDRPILLRSETAAGHGAGKPVSKQTEEFTDIHTFLMWQLGMIEEQP